MRVAADVLLLAATCLGGWAFYEARHVGVPPEDVALRPCNVVTELRGRVLEVRPRPDAGGSIVLDAEPSGLVWVSWPDDRELPCRGDRVVVTGELRQPAGRRNPGAFDFRSYLLNRSIHRTLARSVPVCIERGTGAGRASRWIQDTTERRVPGLPGRVLTALLLGRSGSLPDELRSAFRTSGTVHVLAVSGLHVGFLLVIAHTLLRCLRVPRRAARLLVLPLLAGFVVLVGPRASVLRAAAMATALIAASLTERGGSPANTLGVAALVLMLVRPGCLFDVGFQLSFSAVAGILALHAPVERGIVRALGRVRGVASRAASPLALSLSAQAGVAPVLVATFGELSLISPLANLAVVPLAAAAVASGVATVAAEPLGDWPASAFGACAWLTSRLMALTAQAASRCPAASLMIASRFWPAVLVGSCSLAVLLRSSSRRARVAGASGLLAAAVVAVSLTVWGPGRSHPRVVFFDVGQGDAALLELPGRHFVLVDAGPGPAGAPGGVRNSFGGRDAGADVVVPHLAREGVSRLDALIVTHAHADHFGGAASVLAAVRVEKLVLPEIHVADARLGSLVELAGQRGCAVVGVAGGDTLRAGPHVLRVLAPPREERARCENDASVVLAVELNGTRLLMTGDAETPVEEFLCDNGSDLAADVLKLGHHGSSTSSSRRLLRNAAPLVAVISVGEDNRYGLPDEEILARLDSLSVTVLRTDADGAVVLSVVQGRGRMNTMTGDVSVELSRGSSGREHQPPGEGPTRTNE